MQANRRSLITRLVVPLSILLLALLLAHWITNNPPKSKRGKPSQAPQITVEVLPVTAQRYQIQLDSFGTVKPRTQSALVSQVSGQINFIADNFRDGGFFEPGDVLLTLDDRDYQADVKVAEAALLSAQQQLIEEQARGEQAKIDWLRLAEPGEQASALVLREPQRKAAQANLLSAEARLDKAELALERTRIVAPFAGRVMSRSVDLGQVISANALLASIYASDYVEVRLPLNNRDLAYIALPEEFRLQQGNAAVDYPQVSFRSNLMPDQQWQGRVIRTESAIDSNAQQLYVVAQVDDPYARVENRMPLKINQYVNARIAGRVLEDVIVIPNKAIYQGSYVYTFEQGVLKRKAVTIGWKNDQDALILDGLAAGEQLVITTLGQVSSGTPVALAGAAQPPATKRQGKNAQRQEAAQ